MEPENPHVQQKLLWAEQTRAQGGRTVPSTIEAELAHNPFMRISQPAVRAYTGASDDVTAMRILRNKKVWPRRPRRHA